MCNIFQIIGFQTFDIIQVRLSSRSSTLCYTFRNMISQKLGIVCASCDDVTGDATAREYCQLETFSARCRHGDVVVMTTARFGRMRVGKCIDGGEQSAALEELLQKVDPNSLGCYSNVLDYADRTCSGKTACDIFVPNRDLLSTRPCLSQLTMYFEAAYHCVSGKSIQIFKPASHDGKISVKCQ